MTAIASLAFMATSLILLSIGLRLLWVARRTRQLPELVIGLAYGSGIVGLFMLISAIQVTRRGDDAFALWLCATILIQAGQAALIVGTWRIFRPEAVWGARLTLLGAVLVLAPIGLAAVQTKPQLYTEPTPLIVLTSLTPVLTYAWIAIESFLYAARLRRRRSLGLADTLAVWRFTAWGIAGCLAGLVAPISLFSVLWYGVGMTQVPWLFILTQILMVIGAVNTGFAFFPPWFYQLAARRRDASIRSAESHASADSAGLSESR